MKKKSDEEKKGGLGRVSTVVIALVSLVVIAMFSLGVVAVSSTESTCEEYVMDEIYSGGVKDIVFQDMGNGICLYINRGEDRYSIEDLRSALLGKKAVYTFTRCGWAKAHPLRRIVCEGRVVYES
ncbi:hypothetical protein [Tannerella forsythia]